MPRHQRRRQQRAPRPHRPRRRRPTPLAFRGLTSTFGRPRRSPRSTSARSRTGRPAAAGSQATGRPCGSARTARSSGSIRRRRPFGHGFRSSRAITAGRSRCRRARSGRTDLGRTLIRSRAGTPRPGSQGPRSRWLGALTPVFADGSIWVPEETAGSVIRIDPTTNKILATIAMSSGGSRPSLGGVVAGDGAIWVSTSFGEIAPDRSEDEQDRRHDPPDGSRWRDDHRERHLVERVRRRVWVDRVGSRCHVGRDIVGHVARRRHHERARPSGRRLGRPRAA